MSTPAAKPAPETLSVEQLHRSLSRKIARGELDIPPFPAVAMKLRETIASGDYRLADLATIVKSDEALAATMLRTANSPLYRRGPDVNTVERALSLIGTEESCRIAIAATLGQALIRSTALTELRMTLWRQSLSAAVTAQALAAHRRQDPDHAFMAGLLHDMGCLVAVAGLEETLRESKYEGNLTARDWMAVVQSFHVQLGEMIAARWNLSELLFDVVVNHHRPASSQHPELIHVIATADQIVALMEDCPYLLPRDIEALTLIRDKREAQAMMAYLPLIPGFITSIGGTHSGFSLTPSRIEKPDRVLSGPRKILSLEASWVRSTGDTACLIEEITDEGFVVRLREAMPEGGVGRFRIPDASDDGAKLSANDNRADEPEDGLVVSGRVLLTNPVDSEHRSEIRLFALPGSDRGTWERFYEENGEAES